MRSYRDEAVVVRHHNLGEADRIVTLLTVEHGLVRAVAKGLRRTRSKFGGRLEPFAHVSVVLYPGRSLDLITGADTIDAWDDRLTADYETYATACTVLETAERLAGEERAPAPRLQRLTVGALAALAMTERPRQYVLDAYLLRAMHQAGWAPSLDACAQCGRPGPHRAFHAAVGGAVCVRCRPAGSATPSEGVLALMDALYRGRWDATGDATAAARREASGLVAGHLQWHLERRLRALPLLVAERRRLDGMDRGEDAGGARASEPAREPGRSTDSVRTEEERAG